MGLLNRAGPWLVDMMQTAAADPGVRLVYTRKAGGEPIDLTGTAWVGRTAFARAPGTAGAAIVFGDRDYLIPVTALPAEPARGDRITETIGAAVTVYELVSQPGEPEWRYSDQEKSVYRVHTKEQKGAG